MLWTQAPEPWLAASFTFEKRKLPLSTGQVRSRTNESMVSLGETTCTSPIWGLKRYVANLGTPVSSEAPPMTSCGHQGASAQPLSAPPLSRTTELLRDMGEVRRWNVMSCGQWIRSHKIKYIHVTQTASLLRYTRKPKCSSRLDMKSKCETYARVLLAGIAAARFKGHWKHCEPFPTTLRFHHW